MPKAGSSSAANPMAATRQGLLAELHSGSYGCVTSTTAIGSSSGLRRSGTKAWNASPWTTLSRPWPSTRSIRARSSGACSPTRPRSTSKTIVASGEYMVTPSDGPVERSLLVTSALRVW